MPPPHSRRCDGQPSWGPPMPSGSPRGLPPAASTRMSLPWTAGRRRRTMPEGTTSRRAPCPQRGRPCGLSSGRGQLSVSGLDVTAEVQSTLDSSERSFKDRCSVPILVFTFSLIWECDSSFLSLSGACESSQREGREEEGEAGPQSSRSLPLAPAGPPGAHTCPGRVGAMRAWV